MSDRFSIHITRDAFWVKPFSARVRDWDNPNPWGRDAHHASWTLRGAKRWAAKHVARLTKNKKESK